jgi:4-amino-4-deoxy-L-arabinose transferase-like glycosyltransferase
MSPADWLAFLVAALRVNRFGYALDWHAVAHFFFSTVSLMSPLTVSKKHWLTIAALWCFLLFLAALRPMALPDEGRYTEVSRWMLVSGDWLAPRLDGLPFFHKPPLLHWLQSITFAVTGVSVWTARLVPALHGGLMLVGIYLATRKIAGEATAGRAVWMLGSSLTFLFAGQFSNHDILVATWISVAIGCFAAAFMGSDSDGRVNAAWARWGFAACALAVLSKGLIGLVLPGLVMFCWLIWTHQFGKIRRLPWLSGLLLFAAIALPWFVLSQLKYPEFFDYIIIKQHFARYTASTFNSVNPWWFYLMTLAVLFFPWCIFSLSPLLRFLPLLRLQNTTRNPTPTTNSPIKAWSALCWIWLLSVLIFFSLPSSKLLGYILPAVPPLAMLAAMGWDSAMQKVKHARRWFAAVVILNLSFALIGSVFSMKYTSEVLSRDVAAVLACEAAASDTIYALGAYPYDLPFYLQVTRPLVVISDWPNLRSQVGDSWQRELLESADFDPLAAQTLQSPAQLAQAKNKPGAWLITPISLVNNAATDGWSFVFKGIGWNLWRSNPELPLTISGAVKGLPGCNK